MTPQTKDVNKIKRRMQQITTPEKAYYINNENNLRLCHIEYDVLAKKYRYKYLVIPFCSCEELTDAAQLLKDCGIVDGYRVVRFSEEAFYVELIEYRMHRHFDRKGRSIDVSVKATKEWSDVKLTQYDVKHFIARFELDHPKDRHNTPVIQMPIRKHNTQRAA